MPKPKRSYTRAGIDPSKKKGYNERARTMRRGSYKNPDGSQSTVRMRTETDGKGNWFSFPSLFQNPDGSWKDMSDESKYHWEDVYSEAKRRGEVFDFGKDKESALRFGEGSWKPTSFKNKSRMFRSR